VAITLQQIDDAFAQRCFVFDHENSHGYMVPHPM
jgi:hypothetical protein